MNEQLIVKNFGPIKDATVDFKRVTVFIGPTGGGKSTLAKLIIILKNKHFLSNQNQSKISFFRNLSLDKYFYEKTFIGIVNGKFSLALDNKLDFGGSSMASDEVSQLLEKEFKTTELDSTDIQLMIESLSDITDKLSTDGHPRFIFQALSKLASKNKKSHDKLAKILAGLGKNNVHFEPKYFPAERIFVSAIEYSWAGLMRDDISLPKTVLEFANTFSIARREVNELEIPFINAKYIHSDGLDYIKVAGSDELFRMNEVASGIQSVTPMLVLLEYLGRTTGQAQSFIIEEPELNLFPLAQFELVKILVEKCAQTEGKNDLVLTTHSPYVLTALNLLCYAFRIAQQDEATAKKVAKLIPRHCWIDPDQFAAYYVDRPDTKRKQQVRSIINKKTGLIEENELDTASDELGAIFDKLVRLRKPTQTPSRAK